ncbi:protein ACCELERATED CELL DEATH 6-like [Spinacia oleracea]|uniref:Protein ACCELERATED CELL DEATH 6-like n=1 Tax=Spinacia oleracea TaxID=3562 RepID=A0ABM3RNW0_SPIOL|nr:protein ACCELERATED CELL DEATH 6-like [Spinacia oleracea]
MVCLIACIKVMCWHLIGKLLRLAYNNPPNHHNFQGSLSDIEMLMMRIAFSVSTSIITNKVTKLMIEGKNKEGDTPLHVAIKSHQNDVAKYLIRVTPEVACCVNCEGVSPLLLAVKLGMKEIVQYAFLMLRFTSREALLAHSEKVSLAHAAIKARNLGMLEIVMEELPSLIDSLNGKGWKPLSYAAYKGYLDQVSYFLQKFPDSAKKSDTDGSFPIHKAVGANHVSIVKVFLSSCPSTIHDVDEKGQSILHIAVRYARADVFSYLTKQKEVEKIFYLKDGQGKTFMDLANELKRNIAE